MSDQGPQSGGGGGSDDVAPTAQQQPQSPAGGTTRRGSLRAAKQLAALEDLWQQNALLAADKDSLAGRVQTLQAACDESLAQQAALKLSHKQQLDTLQDSQRALQQQLADACASAEESKAQVTAARSEVHAVLAAREQRCHALRVEVATLRSQLEDKGSEADSLRRKHTAATSLTAALEQELDAVSGGIAKLQLRLDGQAGQLRLHEERVLETVQTGEKLAEQLERQGRVLAAAEARLEQQQALSTAMQDAHAAALAQLTQQLDQARADGRAAAAQEQAQVARLADELQAAQRATREAAACAGTATQERNAAVLGLVVAVAAANRAQVATAPLAVHAAECAAPDVAAEAVPAAGVAGLTAPHSAGADTPAPATAAGSSDGAAVAAASGPHAGTKRSWAAHQAPAVPSEPADGEPPAASRRRLSSSAQHSVAAPVSVMAVLSRLPQSDTQQQQQQPVGSGGTASAVQRLARPDCGQHMARAAGSPAASTPAARLPTFVPSGKALQQQAQYQQQLRGRALPPAPHQHQHQHRPPPQHAAMPGASGSRPAADGLPVSTSDGTPMVQPRGAATGEAADTLATGSLKDTVPPSESNPAAAAAVSACAPAPVASRHTAAADAPAAAAAGGGGGGGGGALELRADPPAPRVRPAAGQMGLLFCAMAGCESSDDDETGPSYLQQPV